MVAASTFDEMQTMTKNSIRTFTKAFFLIISILYIPFILIYMLPHQTNTYTESLVIGKVSERVFSSVLIFEPKGLRVRDCSICFW